jgi:hypothetical protein
MAAATLISTPKAIAPAPSERGAQELRHSLLLLELSTETALKGALSSVKMLEVSLEEIRRMRSS